MAVTLFEAAKAALGRNETYKAGIMATYAKSSPLLAAIGWDDISGNAYSFSREGMLPGVAFRGVNSGYTESTGTLDPVTETLKIAGGDLDVDKYLVKTHGEGVRITHEAMKVKALSLAITKEIIKGDVATDAKGFDGLQARCTGTGLLLSAGTTANGAALTLTALDELIDAVEDPTHLIMNKTMRRRLSAAARSSSVGGYITYEKDEFGKTVTTYNELPILVVDKDQTNSDILPFSEAAASGTDTATSIYCVSFTDDGVKGLQNSEMDVQDLGEIDSKPVFRARVEWYVTLAILRARAAARLRHIGNLAVTA